MTKFFHGPEKQRKYCVFNCRSTAKTTAVCFSALKTGTLFVRLKVRNFQTSLALTSAMVFSPQGADLTPIPMAHRFTDLTPGGQISPHPNGTPVRPTRRNSKLCIKCCYFPCVLLGANINKFHCLPSCETAVPTGTPTSTKFCGHVQHVSSIAYPQWNL